MAGPNSPVPGSTAQQPQSFQALVRGALGHQQQPAFDGPAGRGSRALPGCMVPIADLHQLGQPAYGELAAAGGMQRMHSAPLSAAGASGALLLLLLHSIRTACG